MKHPLGGLSATQNPRIRGPRLFVQVFFSRFVLALHMAGRTIRYPQKSELTHYATHTYCMYTYALCVSQAHLHFVSNVCTDAASTLPEAFILFRLALVSLLAALCSQYFWFWHSGSLPGPAVHQDCCQLHICTRLNARSPWGPHLRI